MLNFSNLELNDFSFFLVILIIAIISLFLTKKLLHLSFPYFFMGIFGLLLGLWIGSLAGAPLSRLPGDFGRYLPIIVNVFVAIAVLDLFIAQARPIALIMRRFFHKLDITSTAMPQSQEIILDSSVLIDGRLHEVIAAGFISGTLIVPDFILRELQRISDSKDGLRREKGRRGLDIINDLRNDNRIKIELMETSGHSNLDVDSRLLDLAKKRKAKIMTLDYNLNKVASLQEISILNLNELALSLKPILLPGESTSVKIIQKGKERNQGIGYLQDGTMIVVEGGDKYVGREIECEVNHIYQTMAGKMIFVKPNPPPTLTAKPS